jgi:hypothetical protein
MRIFAKALFSNVEIVLAAVFIQPSFAVPRLTSDSYYINNTELVIIQ